MPENITFQKNPVKLSFKQQIRFVIANARLEGQHLTFSEIKGLVSIARGKSTAGELIEKSIMKKGLRNKPKVVRKT